MCVKTLKTSPPTFILATWSPHHNRLDPVTICRVIRTNWISSLWILLYSTFSSLLANIGLRILFSNVFTLLFPKLKRPCFTGTQYKGNIIVLFIQYIGQV